MANKTNRTYCLDVGVVNAFEAMVKGGERSKFVNDALAGMVGLKLDKKDGVPVDGLMAASIAELSKKLEDSEAELSKLKEEHGQLKERYEKYLKHGGTYRLTA